MKHLIPPILLVVMLALVLSGLHRYLFAFSLTATLFHLVSALLVIAFTGVHLYQHWKPLVFHFKKILTSFKRSSIVLFILGLIFIPILTKSKDSHWIQAGSYEERKKAIIFRPHHQVSVQEIDHEVKVNRKADGVNLKVECDLNDVENICLAIWAESNGEMIEPLYLSPRLAYSKEIVFEEDDLKREELLPIFFDGLSKMKKRLSPELDEVDGVSAATIVGSFNLDSLFESRLKQFSILVEVNILGDENDSFSHLGSSQITQMPKGVGVPSFLLQSDIDLYEDKKYYLMEHIGRSELGDEVPSLIYDMEGLSEAQSVIEKVLIQVKNRDN